MRFQLEALEPAWVAEEGDWGCGVSWTCWVCGCRHLALFRNGLGGFDGPSPQDVRAYWRTGSSFSTLSLEPAVDISPCGRALLHGGVFYVLTH